MTGSKGRNLRSGRRDELMGRGEPGAGGPGDGVFSVDHQGVVAQKGALGADAAVEPDSAL